MEDFIRAISNPEIIEKVMRLRNDGHFSVTNIVKVANPGTEEWEYLAVAISLSKDKQGVHQITTVHPMNARQIFKDRDLRKMVRDKYKLINK